jgi:hypothetical protein
MVALLGMVVLTVDVGAIAGKRREMVTAADAAALAAAQSCALDDGVAEAEAEAGKLATYNVPDAELVDIAFDGGCVRGSGSVTVEYLGTQGLFFAPVLGLDESTDVHAVATAEWAGVGRVRPLPVVLDLGEGLGACDIPNIPDGTQCAFWFNNNEFGGALFGLMNLAQWDVPARAGCSSAGAAERSRWIDLDYPTFRDLRWPLPTYVCADSGLTSNWRHDLGAEAGQIHPFPINDPDGRYGAGHGQVDSRGRPCLGATGCVPHKYDIVGFARMRVDLVLAGNDPRAVGPTGYCRPRSVDASASCLVATWMGSTIHDGEPGTGFDFGVRAIRLTG